MNTREVDGVVQNNFIERLKTSLVLADTMCCGKEFYRGTTLGKYDPRCTWVRVSGLYKGRLWEWRRSGAGWGVKIDN